MRVSFAARLALLLGLGLALRVVLAFTTAGLTFDLHSLLLVEQVLHRHPLQLYQSLNTHIRYRWPYLSGYFPVVLITGTIGNHTGLAFTSLIRIPPAIADIAIAWVVQDFLRWHGATERFRLLAAAAVSLGPVFIAISAYNGQLDSVAVLPAVIAVAWWSRMDASRRALVAGILIGIGGALKTFPALAVLALLPTCRSRRERLTLISLAIAVPVLASAPWLLHNAHQVINAVKYRSLAGQGGISLLAQPDLAGIWLGGPFHHLSGLSSALQAALGTVILVAGLCATTFIVLRYHVTAARASVLLWLAFFAFGVNFSPRYAVWGLPFFLMERHLWKSWGLQALLIIPTVLLLEGPYKNHVVVDVYVPLMLAAWVAFTGASVMLARRIVGDARDYRPRGV